jgi:hypothetical protein
MISIISEDKYKRILEIPMANDSQGTFVVITPDKKYQALYNIKGKILEKKFKCIIDCTKWFIKLRHQNPKGVKIKLECDGSELFRNIEALMLVYEIKHMKKYEERLNCNRVKAILIATPKAIHTDSSQLDVSDYSLIRSSLISSVQS